MQPSFSYIPDVTKNLLILNILMFLAVISLGNIVPEYCMIYYIQNDNFYPFQLVTAFFLHIDPFHLLFNMFALYMFGGEVERTLGVKKYLFIYLSAGFGANFLSMGLDYAQVQYLLDGLNQEQIAWATGQLPKISTDLHVSRMDQIAKIWLSPKLGASGATFGILFTFAALYPNRIIQLIIPPIPLRAVNMVFFMSLMEFTFHASDLQTGIAHMVHLAGGAIAIFILWFWRKQGSRF